MAKEYKISYRRIALKAAEELQYDQSVIDRIKAAKTDSEIERIMIAARKAMDDSDKKTVHYFRRKVE